MGNTKIMNDQSQCPNIAVYMVPWAGRILKACHVHTRALQALARAIGSPVEVQPVGQGIIEPCYSIDDLEEFKKAEEELKAKKAVDKSDKT